jgi:tetratricopeptide (TPR) repeat protein
MLRILDFVKATGIKVDEGRACLVDSVLLLKANQASQAEKAVNRAIEIFETDGCERDLMYAHLEKSRICLLRDNFEETYLSLEEGFYLAKKFNYSYMKANYYYEMGILELFISDKSLKRAEERFRYAEKIATHAPFREILWRIQFYLAYIMELTGNTEEKQYYEEKARHERDRILSCIPEGCRRQYIKSVLTTRAIAEGKKKSAALQYT